MIRLYFHSNGCIVRHAITPLCTTRWGVLRDVLHWRVWRGIVLHFSNDPSCFCVETACSGSVSATRWAPPSRHICSTLRVSIRTRRPWPVLIGFNTFSQPCPGVNALVWCLCGPFNIAWPTTLEGWVNKAENARCLLCVQYLPNMVLNIANRFRVVISVVFFFVLAFTEN